eukprot:g1362.t1
MAEAEGDAEVAAMARLRGEIIRLQSEQARRRENIRRQDQRHQALKEELFSRKDEATKLCNVIEFEASKLANAALQQQNMEATQALEKQEALKKSCATLLDEFIPRVYSSAGEKLANRANKLGGAGGDPHGDAGDDDTEKKEPYHDVIWMTYTRPETEDFNFQMTMKISREAVVRDLVEDACEYWGCSARENVVYKGEKEPRPITEQRILVTSTIVAQRDLETRLTQKEDLMQNLDENGRVLRNVTLGANLLLEGDLFLGVIFDEEGAKWVKDAGLVNHDGSKTTAEQLVARSAEDDQLVFQFDETRRVSEVLSLTDIAHLYLVHRQEAGAWVQRLEEVNMEATRSAQYPACLDAVRAWPGLFADLTNATGKSYMIQSTLHQTKCRDVCVYAFLLLLTFLSLSMGVNTEVHYWAVEGENKMKPHASTRRLQPKRKRVTTTKGEKETEMIMKMIMILILKQLLLLNLKLMLVLGIGLR